jgi:hypothetical protein
VSEITTVQGDQAPEKLQKMFLKVGELLHEVRRRNIHEVADNVGISCGFLQEILIETLNMRHVAPSS